MKLYHYAYALGPVDTNFHRRKAEAPLKLGVGAQGQVAQQDISTAERRRPH